MTTDITPERLAQINEYADYLLSQPTERRTDGILYADQMLGYTRAEIAKLYDLLRKDALKTVRQWDSAISPEWLEQYAGYRQRGLTVSETAKMMGIVPDVMRGILSGALIESVDIYMSIARCEMRVSVAKKDKALSAVMGSIEDGNAGIALALLERRYAKEWARNDKPHKAKDVQALKVCVQSPDYELLATRAAERLDELRALRKARGGMWQK